MMERKRTSLSALLLISILFFLASGTADAQRRASAVKEKEDSTAFFRGIAVGGDAIGPAMRSLASYGQYEALLRLNIKDRYYPVVEAGVGKADKSDETTGTEFKTSAPFARVGCDFNMLKNKHDDYRFLVGGRLGYTSFKYDVHSPGIVGNKGSQFWAEVVGGVDARIWGMIRMGWTVRYKLRLAHKADGIGEPWYVPGYGRGGSSRLGATFNILLEL